MYRIEKMVTLLTAAGSSNDCLVSLMKMSIRGERETERETEIENLFSIISDANDFINSTNRVTIRRNTI